MQTKVQTKNWIRLFAANFFGILNDNFIKHCLIFIAINWSAPDWWTQSLLISSVSAALVIPYLIFAPLSGKIAVLYSKQKIFKICKLLEFPIVAIAILGFYLQSVFIAWLAILFMGIQSCMYSPAKYGLIRDIGGLEKVSFGSGIFETMAFLAILVGTCLAAFLSDCYNFYIVAGLFLLFAVGGWYCVHRIKVQEEPIEDNLTTTINPFRFILQSFVFAKKFKNLNAGIFGVAIFWLIGGLIQMNLVIYCTNTLELTNTTAGIIMAIAAIGIAIGCSLGGKMNSFVKDKYMIICSLSIMILSLLLIIYLNQSLYTCSFLIFIFAFVGGCFEVPCLAMIQKADTGRKNADMLAYMNLITFLFILIGSFIFSFVTSITNENSIVVFEIIVLICLVTLIYFIFRI